MAKDTHRYSNITCTPTNIQTQAAPRNPRPDQVPMISLTIYVIPSVPIANPTRLADIIIKMLNTAPPAQICRYHALLPYCRIHDQYLLTKMSWVEEHTCDAGSMYTAINSGAMKRLTSHPHASSRNDKSCHNATNVNIRQVVKATFFTPPRGI